jgi:hypothetical protein
VLRATNFPGAFEQQRHFPAHPLAKTNKFITEKLQPQSYFIYLINPTRVISILSLVRSGAMQPA